MKDEVITRGVQRAAQGLQEVGNWVLRAPVVVIAGLLIVVSLFRNGIVVWNWFELSPFLLTNWDTPASAFQSNVLLNALATSWQALGLNPTSFAWQMFQVALTLATFVGLAVLVIRRTSLQGSYLPLALVLSSGVAAVLWREIGRYDTLYVLGMATAVLATRQWLVWLGVLVAAASSPEQALTAGFLLLGLGLIREFAAWRVVAIRIISGSVLVLLAVQGWFFVAGSPEKTRIGTLVEHFLGIEIEAASAYDTSQSFTQFTIEKAMISLSAGPALVWSYLGATSLLLILFLLVQRSWARSLYLVGVVIAAPIVIGFTFGEDRTRDIALICVPMIIALAMTGSQYVTRMLTSVSGDTLIWLAWLAIVVTVVPATYFYLDAEEPWRWTKELLISINNGVPMVNDGSLR